jgi:nucleoside-diphosphate-sugar epimerase
MKRVLIVGGAGYLGGALTDLLMKSQHEFRVYDSLLYESEYRKPVVLIVGDVRDKAKLKNQLDWADTVVWLAAIVGDAACAADPKLTYEINENSVEWLSHNFKGRIIFMSTCSIYGANEGILSEGSSLNPLSLYARTKEAAELHLAESQAVIFRLGTLFGVGDNYSRIRMDLVVNTLTAKAFYCGRITVYGGEQYRPLLHVKDAARAIASCLDKPNTGIFNLHAHNMRILDIAELAKKHFPGLTVTRTDANSPYKRNYRVSSDKAINSLNFNPSLSIGDGIEEIKGLLQEGRIRNINSSRYSNAVFVKDLVASPHTPIGYEINKPI